MKNAVRSASGLLIVSPEYNRSIPTVLKNALDHGSRPAGKSVWAGKPAGIIHVSTGGIGTALARQHLRSILSCPDVSVMRQPEAYLRLREGMFGNDGTIGPATGKGSLLPEYKRPFTIEACDENGDVLYSYHLSHCQVDEYRAFPDPDAGSIEVAIEHLILGYDDWSREPPEKKLPREP
ncbi:NAD(P)H-dependent oxidoreductase [Methanoregula sp.]|uniref:NAD(P)H-dependent oxidoreductase n=1 Tax=Methanoregula sp. TaxID=2052170 RepID=UPI0025CF85D0|nr:NAD(P)H-dependent oxidoreductase [Methanoregula sp.]